MKTALFDFELPEELVAAAPAEPRDSARMLVVDDGVRDSTIKHLVDCVRPGDVLVLNNTKVIPARLYGKRGEARVEILLHKKMADGWQCFAKPAKRLRPDDSIIFADGFSAKLIEKRADGQVVLQFAFADEELHAKLEQFGQMPLPPYIEKKRQADDNDKQHYQTVFAQHEGSVAAPTAGLHFTPELLQAISDKGVSIAYVTLHVGGGTFLPVKVEDTNDHVMHSEWGEITAETAVTINKARKAGGRVVAVGTTALRTLESAVSESGELQPFCGETDIFITPGYRFKIVDMLLTNFHLPRSTLFMLVSAFSGLEAMKSAYQHAIEQKYRFYSYGDACLLYAKP